MKKIIKVFLAVLTLFITTISPLYGCGADGPKVDNTKSQLYIGNLYAGFGDEWTQTWRKNFEEMHAETEFEPGKKGVQIWIDNQRDLYTGANIESSIRSYTQDLYFTEDPNIYSLVANGACADITDIVTENLSAKYGEDNSIEGKMSQSFLDCLKLNDKYYILPLNESYMNIVYDIDLFYDKGFFISNTSTQSSTKFTKVKAEFAFGPDNVQGTYDDGLPATYAQFYDLLQKIKGSSITPFIWSGVNYSTYGSSFTTQAWADASGIDEFMLNSTFSGDAVTLVDTITESKKRYGSKDYDVSTVTLAPSTPISYSNGAELQKQAGKFYALQFTSNIVKDPTNYDALAFSPSLSHTGAQTSYLYSKYNTNGKRIAMLIDGSWWSVEAKSKFADMAVEYGEEDSRSSRRFGLMPIPKPTADMVGQPATFRSSIRGAAFISAYCPESKLKLAKEFLQYCFTNEGMKIYTRVTDTPMPYNYTFDSDADLDAFLNSLTTYGRCLWDNHINDRVIVAGLVNNDFYINNYSYFREDFDFRIAINEYTGKYPFAAFEDVSSLTPKKYFEGLYAYHSTSSIWR